MDPDTRLGPYEIKEPLGKGGMGEVYRARDGTLRRDVAIKLLPEDMADDPERLARLKREARALATLNHPHIATVHGFEEHDGTAFIVMELVEGETLAERLREGALGVEEALAIGAQIAEALEAAHERGIVHRDLKPANVKITPAGRAKVLDFGLAKPLRREAEGLDTELPTATVEATKMGAVVGTPPYMSPEQVRGEQVDERTDVWAFGCLLYEMLTGRSPFVAETAGDTLAAVLTREPAWDRLPPDTPASVQELLEGCLQKDRDNRRQDVGEMQEQLEEALQAPDSAVTWGGRPTRYRRALRRRRAAWVMGTLGVLGLLVIVIWSFGFFGEGPPDTGAAAAAPEIRSLAVLPLDNLSGDPEQEYFSDGMTEALTAELARIGALEVISRTSAMSYKGSDKRMPEIAAELGVEGLIEGSVRQAGDEVFIRLNLIHGPTDRQLWSGQYQREMRNVLTLQNDVARAIAEEVEVTLEPEEEERLATAHAVDPAAYEDYLRGMYEVNKLTLEGWEAAIGHFERSIERDPTYAPAYAMMSFTHSYLGYQSRRPPSVVHSRALVAAREALALDDSLAEAHASLALVETAFGWDWAAADRASQKALELNPNSTMVLFSRAFFLTFVGRHEEAIDIMKRSLELDPLALHLKSWLGMYYFFARDYDRAIEQLQEVIDLEPDYREAHAWLAFSYAKNGMHEEVARESAIITWHWHWLEAWLLAVAGRSAEARELLERAQAEQRVTPRDAYLLAMALGELGEKDRAFALLEQAYQGRSSTMSLLKVDPRLDALRGDPRFEDLLQRMNFPD